MRTTDLIPILLYHLKDSDKYGLELVNACSDCSDGKIQIKQPTLYSLLKKLEKSKFITSYWKDSAIGGKRHYFRITENGLAQLETYPTLEELVKTALENANEPDDEKEDDDDIKENVVNTTKVEEKSPFDNFVLPESSKETESESNFDPFANFLTNGEEKRDNETLDDEKRDEDEKHDEEIISSPIESEIQTSHVGNEENSQVDDLSVNAEKTDGDNFSSTIESNNETKLSTDDDKSYSHDEFSVQEEKLNEEGKLNNEEILDDGVSSIESNKGDNLEVESSSPVKSSEETEEIESVSNNAYETESETIENINEETKSESFVESSQTETYQETEHHDEATAYSDAVINKDSTHSNNIFDVLPYHEEEKNSAPTNDAAPLLQKEDSEKENLVEETGQTEESNKNLYENIKDVDVNVHEVNGSTDSNKNETTSPSEDDKISEKPKTDFFLENPFYSSKEKTLNEKTSFEINDENVKTIQEKKKDDAFASEKSVSTFTKYPIKPAASEFNVNVEPHEEILESPAPIPQIGKFDIASRDYIDYKNDKQIIKAKKTAKEILLKSLLNCFIAMLILCPCFVVSCKSGLTVIGGLIVGAFILYFVLSTCKLIGDFRYTYVNYIQKSYEFNVKKQIIIRSIIFACIFIFVLIFNIAHNAKTMFTGSNFSNLYAPIIASLTLYIEFIINLIYIKYIANKKN